MLEVRAECPWHESIQWKHLTARKLPYYLRVIDQFLYWNREHLVDFHALVVERPKLRNREYNHGDGEEAFDKFMYQSLIALYRRYPDAKRLRCIHGIRTSPYPLEAIRTKLNNTVSKPSNVFLMPYRELKYGVVQDWGPLQIADLVLGAVGAAWNARRHPIRSPHRQRIVDHLRSECCVDQLDAKSPKSAPHFDIWEFRLRS